MEKEVVHELALKFVPPTYRSARSVSSAVLLSVSGHGAGFNKSSSRDRLVTLL